MKEVSVRLYSIQEVDSFFSFFESKYSAEAATGQLLSAISGMYALMLYISSYRTDIYFLTDFCKKCPYCACHPRYTVKVHRRQEEDDANELVVFEPASPDSEQSS